MSALRILVLYGTRYGQTAKIANRLAEVLRTRGSAVMVQCADGGALPVPLGEFDGVMIGGSVIGGRHQRSIERFVRAHRAELGGRPTAFFSVSGSAGSKDPRGRADAERCVDRFVAETGWEPSMRSTIAGAIAYTRYHPLLRWFMKRMSRKSGGSTDTTRDHEYTDWSQVEHFAREFSWLAERRALRAASRDGARELLRVR